MNRFFIALGLILLSSVVSAETMHITLIPPETSTELTKSDVSLRLDDVETPVKEFFKIDTASRTEETLFLPGARRQYILLVDIVNLDPSQILEARKLTQDFVAQVPKKDLILLAGITHTDGLRLFSGLTTDRTKLVAGWNAIGSAVLSGMIEGPEGNLYPANYSPGSISLQLLPDEEFVAKLKGSTFDEKGRKKLAPVYVQAFVDLSSLLSTISGRKNIILFSPGVDIKGLSVQLDEAEEKSEKKEKKEQKEEEHKDIEDITNIQRPTEEQLANVGPKRQKGRGSDPNVIAKLMEATDTHVYVFSPSPDSNGFLDDLVQKTRGAYKRSQEFAASVALILQSDRIFYVIGWEGQSQQSYRELRALHIKAGNHAIQAPLRWIAPKPVSEYTPLEKRIYLSQALYMKLGPSEPCRYWFDIILDETSNRISTFTEFPGASLLNKNSQNLKLEFLGYVLEEDGTIVDFYNVPLHLDLTKTALTDRLQKAGLKVWNVLFANQGPVNVRMIVMNQDTGQIIAHSERIDFKDTDFLLTNPFFPSTNFDWVFWPRPDEPQTRRGREIAYPYILDGAIFSPELSPRVNSTDKGKVVYFKMYNFPKVGKYPPIELRFINKEGGSFEVEKFSLMQKPKAVPRDGVELFWQIETLPALSKGSYYLQIDVTDQLHGKDIIKNLLTSVE